MCAGLYRRTVVVCTQACGFIGQKNDPSDSSILIKGRKVIRAEGNGCFFSSFACLDWRSRCEKSKGAAKRHEERMGLQLCSYTRAALLPVGDQSICPQPAATPQASKINSGGGWSRFGRSLRRTRLARQSSHE